MKVYRRLLGYIRPYHKFVLPFFVLTLIASFFSVFQFTLLIPLLKFLFDPSSATDNAQYAVAPVFSFSAGFFKNYFYHLVYEFKTTKPVYALYFMAGLIVITVILTNLFRYLAQRSMIKTRTLLVKRLREALFEKINRLQLGYFTKEHKGDLISRLNGDVYGVEGAAASSLEVLFKEPYLIIFFFIGLFAISVQLTIFTLIIIPVAGIAIATITKKLKSEAKDVQASAGRLLTIIDETLLGMRIIRSFNATNFIQKRFSRENDFYRQASLASFNKRELAPAFSEAAGVMVVAGILIYGGGLVLSGTGGLQASSFITFIILFSQVIRPVKSLVTALSNVQIGQASGERILEILDKPVEIEDKPNAIPMKAFKDKIELVDVSFQYGEKQVLKNINLTVDKGRTIALVGPSGVGKSTIADLIPRFYEVTSGEVLIDGVNVKDYTMESLRSHMSFVTQDIILFNDSIFNNIALGRPDATEEEVMRAAKIANAHEFIMNTEHGYQTNIGDRGIRLSGGQRQRLSIARAVFKNPSILILDEATSALDTEAEKSVQDALNNLMRGRTTLVIAHRLSTIKEADEIIIMQDGCIIERGHHDELIQIEEGVYRRLTSLQRIA
ncbi:ABC transporter ATP-binding protein/permease [Terrimonas sp. NA20]|uniref:ABC transporter ATP-binding protein/permease n=1 Tax=Terrimonas ginsenosidimutans TaxID=2908004 RepID=A0ABS9L0K3_9BACT|nr:ABC transporter ATP-binding protein [Terrimonas ginsenosidimutans]MCG2618109.1 ABC transporter ATP-binding protein/permease [Terrimonas ginsenosidimutans]